MAGIAASPQAGSKRAYQTEESSEIDRSTPISPLPHNTSTATSTFRNVSACNRCRVRKNRCDQNLPACNACQKANIRCVGYDPITKREIPRSYVYFLETRLRYFESLLNGNNIPFDTAEVFDADSRLLATSEAVSPATAKRHVPSKNYESTSTLPLAAANHEDDKLDSLVSNIGMVSVHGTSDHRYLGSISGISFARVVLSAVKRSVPVTQNDKSASRISKVSAAGGANERSMRDSYFGLQTKPTIKEAPFPERDLAHRLVTLYFEYANPQIPILHREEFKSLFDRAYSVEPDSRSPRELYLLNIVFAIGAGIIWGSSDPEPDQVEYATKRARLSERQAQPEEYHASAIVHLGAFLSSSGNEGSEGANNDLEELQAVLLLAAFSLLRPIAPGLWYIVGVAMRMAIDLGLHYEDGSGLNDTEFAPKFAEKQSKKSLQLGRRQWMRDLRRRLWWCTYTFDRLVSTCVGRPFGITDQVITTEFPSLLDDKHITPEGIAKDVPVGEPTYKRVSYHYFRLRLLQSEIVQVLQYEQAQIARMNGWNRQNDFMHTKLPSPFLIKHKSFRSWRKDIDQRLFEWKESAPAKQETGVAFSHQFLELNYWQAVTMLYRQSLSVPPPFAGQLSPTEDVVSPASVMTEEKEDEDLIFLKCAEAGQKTLKIYRQLHRQRLVNYTYLATHHLFMAGISFLYAVWHSPAVRSRITLDDFDFTVLAATSVLGDLMVKCPPAEACRDAFERMSKATVQMCMSSPGFGFGSREESYRTPTDQPRSRQTPIIPQSMRSEYRPIAKRPPPKFDMDLRDLFPEGLNAASSSIPRTTHPMARPRSNTQRSRQSRGNIHRNPSYPEDISNDLTSPRDAAMSDIHAPLAPANSSSLYDMNLSYDESQQALADASYPLDPGSNSYNPDFMSNLPDMEFLGRLSGSEALHMGSEIGRNPNLDPGLDDSWNETGSTGDAESEWGLGSGFGVGVGMGLDFGPSHDFSDGQGGFNLFDGFFFSGDDGGQILSKTISTLR